MSKIEQKMRERYEKRAETKEPKQRAWGTIPTNPKGAVNGAYKIVLVRVPNAVKVYRSAKAPDTDRMLERAKQNRSLFVIRYWPSRKGWRVLDARKAQCFDMPNGRGGFYPKWSGHRYLNAVFPSEDAAVMAAWALCAA